MPLLPPLFSPLDEALELVPGSLSPQLLEGLARLGSSMPFARAARDLAFFWGVALSEDTACRQTEEAGAALVAAAAAARRLEREGPAPPQGPAVQQWSLDGAAVPLVHGEWAEVKTAVFGTIAAARDHDGEPAVHATDLGYCSRAAPVDEFARDLRLAIHRQGTHTAGRVVAVNDGAPWIQGVLDTYRPDAVRILDFPHAVEHLAKAAAMTFGADTPAMHAWLGEQARALRHETPEGVLAALAALPTGDDPTGAAAAARDATVGYLEARLPQRQYATFQAAGYPIGSGAVESANKLVVEARLKGGGMHWARANVSPMVALRASRCSGRWDRDWPAILRQLRRQDAAQREARRLRRHPPPPPPGPPNLRLLRSAARKLRAGRPNWPRKKAS